MYLLRDKCMWKRIKRAKRIYICVYIHIMHQHHHSAVVSNHVLICCSVLALKKLYIVPPPPHHLWPPVEPWRGCCRQRSGPGRYSNQHLSAAPTWWWGLRWATLRSDCWAAGVGLERANSAGRRTNSQLVRTWSQYNLEKRQNTHTHTHQTLRAIIWATESLAWLTKLTNSTTCPQFDDLVS